MKLYQMSNEPNRLGFTNYERIDEEILFQDILTQLKSDSRVEVGEKQIGPSEDYYYCNINGRPFILFFDIDYGTEIYSNDVDALRELKEMCNTEE